jgi:pimeloyl-ACP methyl ester carboxylesterase
MGGGMAWLTAAQHPDKVKKLVLLSSAGYDVANVSGKLFMFKPKSRK